MFSYLSFAVAGTGGMMPGMGAGGGMPAMTPEMQKQMSEMMKDPAMIKNVGPCDRRQNLNTRAQK